MQLMSCRNILALVEGITERTFVNLNFPYIDVVTVDNGLSWTIDKLVDRLATLYRLRGYQPAFLVVWLDREGREENVATIRNAIRARFLAEGLKSHQIIIGIPDRMTENWIAADCELMKEVLGNPDYQYVGDGASGVAMLRSLKRTYLGGEYKKMTDGVAWLKKMRLANSAKHSASAKAFLDDFSLECFWLGNGSTAS